MINHELTDLLIIKITCCLAKVDYRKFKCASDASMDDNVNLIKGIFDYFHLDWKTHNKFQAPAAEIPLEDPQVVTEDNANDDVFLYQAAVENCDDLHASEEDLALVGQDVEDGQELPNSQQQEEELPELSASTVVQTGGQGVEESRPAVVHVLVRGRKRGNGVHLRIPRTKRVKKMPARFND